MVEYNLIMDIVKVTHSLKVEGEDAIKFIESLISVDPLEKQLKTSFLLKPDGKVGHWFVVKRDSDDIYIFQGENELNNIKKSLDFYKIRTKCSLEVINDKKYLALELEDKSFKFTEITNPTLSIDWEKLSLVLELPLPETIEAGLLPYQQKV